MLPRRRKSSKLSLPLTLVLMSLTLSSMSLVAGYRADIVHTFVDPDVERLNHLVVDKNTGRVFVGGVNKLYQLSPDLDLVVKETTGPKNDSTECSTIDCPAGVVKKLTDNVNKALVIDYTTTRLISCGSLFQGICTVRNLHDISDVVQEVPEAVVANNATASTVAFIAPGPPNPPVSQVMYVGVTYTANSPYRSDVPAVSSRSLDKERMLMIAETAVTTGTTMFVNSLARERFPINYVYGFSSEGFSYFLTTQPKNTATGSEFISKLVRVCHDDQNYYSYTEIPIDCTNESRKYNLVQAAYAGKAGSDLAGHLGITAQEDVLFAVFSESNATTNRPSSRSALCVYSLKAIRRKFMSNIQHCFAGYGQRGLDFISPSHRCVPTKLQTIAEDFCGLDINSPLEGQDPIAASPVLSFDEHLTAVAATSTGDYTVVFVGTSHGFLRKVVVETATSAFKYGDLEVDPNSPVNSDLHFDAQFTHLYVMTRRKVSKVKVEGCSAYKTCWECLAAKDPYCGWCSLENKCSLRSDCQDADTDLSDWISYKSGRCRIISSVTPNQLQRTTVRTLDLVIENYLPTLSSKFHCAFSALGKTLVTTATRTSYGVKCPTPRTDLLPSIPQSQHHFTAELSVRKPNGPDIVATNFTFFDCNTYSSCTQCVTSSFPCDWCVDRHRCTHDTAENCRNDILVIGVGRIGPSFRNGPGFCPRINAMDSQEILVSSGTTKGISVKVHIIGQFIVQTRFVCQFNIEGRVTSVNAQLLADKIYCDRIEFSYRSRAPNITVPFAVIWGGSKPLDNPGNMHVAIYRCSDMADNCGMCLALAEKYGCGWCQSSGKCEVKDQCDRGSGAWLNRNQTCPNLSIHSFEPQSGPWEGGTNVTIQGINLGKTFSDIYAGVSIAGLPCQPYPELYIRTKQIVCRVDGPGTPQSRKGPVIVKVDDFRGYSKLNFEFVDPVIESISPKYGPRSGGTVIRITGRHMNAGSKIQASIDNLACSIISAEANETLCMTSASDRIRAGILKMKFDGGTREYNGVFEYVDDPTIESVESGVAGQVKIPKGIPAGGIKISVTGKNLGYVQNPQMYVYYDDKMFVSQCANLSHTNMICDSPTIELPPDVELDVEHPLSLEYGFRMDNVIGVQNLSNGFNSFLLYPNPVYEKFDEEVKYYWGDYLTIDGQNLDRACQESDVVVHIGSSFCNITSLSRHQLTCQPPPTQPPPLDTVGFDNEQEFPKVVVVVGGVLNFTIGKLRYALRPELNGSPDKGVGDSGDASTTAIVTPHQLQRTIIPQTLNLAIENLPTSSDQLFCAFAASDVSFVTNATRTFYGVKCATPSTADFLPSIPEAQHHITAKLSVRMTSGPDLVATNFTFFDCDTYSTCTQCLSSRFPCNWCVDGHRCTHDTVENCRDDILITGVSRIGPSYRSQQFCPTMNAIGSSEILVPYGVAKPIRVKVHVTGQFVVQTRFFCRFELEWRFITVGAELVMDSIYCDPVEFSYVSRTPRITVPFAVIWGDSRILENPDHIYVAVYRCRDMAVNYETCVGLAEKYDCEWCQSSNQCEIKDQCDRSSSLGLETNQTLGVHSSGSPLLPSKVKGA